MYNKDVPTAHVPTLGTGTLRTSVFSHFYMTKLIVPKLDERKSQVGRTMVNDREED